MGFGLFSLLTVLVRDFPVSAVWLLCLFSPSAFGIGISQVLRNTEVVYLGGCNYSAFVVQSFSTCCPLHYPAAYTRIRYKHLRWDKPVNMLSVSCWYIHTWFSCLLHLLHTRHVEGDALVLVYYCDVYQDTMIKFVLSRQMIPYTSTPLSATEKINRMQYKALEKVQIGLSARGATR